MIRKLDKLLMELCIFSLFLTGCWDYKDVNEKCITLSLGVDYVDDNIQFSGEIANIAATSREEGESSKASNVYYLLSSGKTFEEARIHYDSINPFPVFLGATRVVIFGQNYANQGIEPYLHRIDSLYDYRKTLLTVVSREPPSEYLKIKVVKDISVGFLIEDILEHLTDRGEALYPNVGELLSDISFGKIGYLLPYIGIEKDSVKYLGLAVMKNSKLVDVIKIEDTDGILYILSEKPVLVETIPSTKDEKNMISFRTKVKKRNINTDYVDEKVVINIDLNLTAELRYQYYTKPVSDEDIKKLQKMISKKVKDSIISIVERSQKEFKCDIFKFAKHFRAEHLKIYEQINWEDAFPNAEINVNVKTKIVNTTLEDTTAKKKY